MKEAPLAVVYQGQTEIFAGMCPSCGARIYVAAWAVEKTNEISCQTCGCKMDVSKKKGEYRAVVK